MFRPRNRIRTLLLLGMPRSSYLERSFYTCRITLAKSDLSRNAKTDMGLAQFPVFPLLLLCYHSTGNTVTGISGRIGLHIVGVGMDNQCCSAIAKNRVAIRSPVHILVDNFGPGLALSVHSEVGQVASVVALRILKPVFLNVWIEMSAG